jgi:hypothetical protein
MDRNFRAADAAETDTFSAVVVQDFDSVAVENGDYGLEANAFSRGYSAAEHDTSEECETERLKPLSKSLSNELSTNS